jgi:penicillin V acylase-like amidase (Ntn superfamily)
MLPLGRSLLDFARRKTALCLLLLVAPLAIACTRVVYIGPDDNVITARSMDWKVDAGTNLWIFPRGMHHTGAAGPHSLEWTSKYGSITASGYDVSPTDGMNEKGLVAILLWLVESQYS